MNKRKKGVIVSYIYSISQVAINLLYVPLLLQGIGSGEYGVYQMIGSLVAYINVMSTTLAAGATRFYSKYYVLGDQKGMASTLSTLRNIYQKFDVVLVVLTLIFVAIFQLIYSSSLTEWELIESSALLGVLAINVVVTLNNTLSVAVITANEEFVFLRLSMLALLLAQPLFVVIAIQFFPYAITVSIVQLVANTVCRGLQHWFAKKRLGMNASHCPVDKKLKKSIFVFSGGIILAALADQLFWKTGQLILGYLYGTSFVAVYAVGIQIINAYSPLGVAISSVFLPRVSELWHEKHDIGTISELFVKVSRIALYPLLALLLGFIIFGKDFVLLWAGDEFELAYFVAIVVLVPFTIDVAQNIGLTILQVMNKYAFRAKMYFIAAIVNILLAIPLSIHFGIMGPALSSALVIFLSSGVILNFYYACVVGLHMGLFWKSIMRQTVPLILYGLAFFVVWNQFQFEASWFALIIGAFVFLSCYALVACFFSANAYEKNLLWTLLTRLIRR